MAEILQISKSIRRNEEDEPALSEISTRQNNAVPSERTDGQLTRVLPPAVKSSSKSPQEWLNALRARPDEAKLIEILVVLDTDNVGQESFSLHSIGPLQAQIINVLIEDIVPVFWPTLSSKGRRGLLNCLNNVAGLSAVIAHINRLNQASTRTKISDGDAGGLSDLLDILNGLLSRDNFAFRVWKDLAGATLDPVKLQLGWKTFVALVGSGKIPATVAQAEDVLRVPGRTESELWLASGSAFSSRLGRAIGTSLAACIAGPQDAPDGLQAAVHLLEKALSMSYTNQLITGLLSFLCESSTLSAVRRECFTALIKSATTSKKRRYVESIIRWLSTVVETDVRHDTFYLQHDVPTISAAAALLREVINNDGVSKELLSEFCGDAALVGSLSFEARRVCICTLADIASDDLEPLLEKLIKMFGGLLFINHAVTRQQDCLAQMIIMTAGYLHRISPMSVLMAARSSGHMQGVSNRLDSSNERARWLGMIVGTALSSKVDKAGSKMSFGTDDMLTREAKWYFSLIDIQDQVREMEDFSPLFTVKSSIGRRRESPQPTARSVEMPIINGKPMFGPVRPPIPVQTEIIGPKVSEVLETDENDEIQAYAKPDSDPEDSDEDATLVKRNKPRPPVYIRDLMTMLRDDKDPDKFGLAVKHAASLIRRKINFGREVTDHAEEIATILCSLQDPFETEDFEMLKLQALTAVLLSDVSNMAPWMSRQAFVGDYSIAQRCTMLSALGLGGRELAGLKDQDVYNPVPSPELVDFPSKRLPQRLHTTYLASGDALRCLEAVGKKLEHHLIEHMALSAADKTTAHLNAVKVRTFSSRIDKQRPEQKSSQNQLAKVFAEAFFFPLMNRYQQDIAAYGTGSLFASTSFVLVTFLKTLALLLHASGPASLHLSDITTSFWDMLLSLRVQATRDISVLEAVLFSLLTLLETNEGSRHRFLQENSSQLAETQTWVELIFERSGQGGLVADGKDQETKVRMLAAGILVKAREIVEAYQKGLMGSRE
jgi:telomere length regulation protein